MSSTFPTSRLRSPEEIAINAGVQVPRLRLPAADVFAERALRLRELAAGHAMRDYLLLMATVCEAQQARLQHFPDVPLPTAADADRASADGVPLLDTARWPRDPIWRTEWRALLSQVRERLPADSPALPGIAAQGGWSDAQLDQQAERLLSGIMLGLDLAAAPLVAAGLQLYWTHLVIATEAAVPNAFGIVQDATRCPCCGSLPTASVTRIGGDHEGYRYLHCSLCNAEWHMVRVKCTHCLGTGGIHYQSVQPLDHAQQAGQREPVQAETCDNCGHYLKIVHMGRDMHAEPVADDLATLTLDLLVAEDGYQRHGTNLFLLFGDADSESVSPEPGGT